MAKKLSEEIKVELGKEVLAKEPAANKLSKQRIDKLFRMFCVQHSIGVFHAHPKELEDCSGCLLREIPWKKKNGQIKDLCYAICREGVLNG